MTRSRIRLPKIQYRKQLTIAMLVCLTVLLITPTTLLAHPSGNFSINRYSRLEVEPESIHMVYIVDMAEVPTHRERTEIDEDGNGEIGAIEEIQYIDRLNAALQKNLHLEVDGQHIPFSIEDSQLSFPIGQAELPTLRLETHFIASLPHDLEEPTITYQDENYAGQVGWQEIVVQSTAETTLLNSTAPAEDISQELRQYPEELLQRPLSVKQASFSFESVAGVAHSHHDKSHEDASHQHAPTTDHHHDASFNLFALIDTLPYPGTLPIMLTLLVALGGGWIFLLRTRQKMERS